MSDLAYATSVELNCGPEQTPVCGVSTSIAAFVDQFARGPVNRPIRVASFEEFEREFGGVSPSSEASYGVFQFFQNGGSEAWIVRVVQSDTTHPHSAAAASVHLGDSRGCGPDRLVFQARDPGAWGNRLRISIDRAGLPGDLFHLTVREVGTLRGRPRVLRTEVFKGLNPQTARQILHAPGTGSCLVRIPDDTPVGMLPPPGNAGVAALVSGRHSQNPALPDAATLEVRLLEGESVVTQSITFRATGSPSLELIAAELQAALRALARLAPAWEGTIVTVTADRRLRLAAGSAGISWIQVAPGPTAEALKLLADGSDEAAHVECREYLLGTGRIHGSAQRDGCAGRDGAPPPAAALIGSAEQHTGLHALEGVDLFNFLCIPRASAIGSEPGALSDAEAQAVILAAESLCERRRALLLLDTPCGIANEEAMARWIHAHAGLRHRNAAFFYPRLRIDDPLAPDRCRSVGASGSVAGVFARNDAARGVWHAPAGAEARLRHVAELEDDLSDGEHGVLQPLAVNCLRSFRLYGSLVWGTRTLAGDENGPVEWRYIPVRRLALYVEESLARGLAWTAQESDGETLRSRIQQLAVGFLESLFQQGAFHGHQPNEAYYVRVEAPKHADSEQPANSLRLVVGLAALKAGEFIVLELPIRTAGA